MRTRSHCDSTPLFRLFMSEPLNSLNTEFYIEKVSAPIFFLADLLSSLPEDPYLVQSEMILSLMYPQFNMDGDTPSHIHAPSQFSRVILNTGTVDIHYFFFRPTPLLSE